MWAKQEETRRKIKQEYDNKKKREKMTKNTGNRRCVSNLCLGPVSNLQINPLTSKLLRKSQFLYQCHHAHTWTILTTLAL